MAYILTFPGENIAAMTWHPMFDPPIEEYFKNKEIAIGYTCSCKDTFIQQVKKGKLTMKEQIRSFFGYKDDHELVEDDYLNYYNMKKSAMENSYTQFNDAMMLLDNMGIATTIPDNDPEMKGPFTSRLTLNERILSLHESLLVEKTEKSHKFLIIS